MPDYVSGHVEDHIRPSASRLAQIHKRNAEIPLSSVVCSILVIKYVNFLQGKLNIFYPDGNGHVALS